MTTTMTSVSRLALVIVMGGLAACSPGRSHDGDGVDGGGGTDSGSGSGSGSDTGSGSDGTTTFVYAHTSDTLYKVDPDTYAVTEIGLFQWPGGATDQMTDIAIDQHGSMVGISFGSVYSVDPLTANTTLLSATLTGTFNGMSFVPATTIGQTGDDVLVATRADDGEVFRIDPTTGVATQIGNMGGAFASSGDIVAVTGFGAVQTVPGGLTGGDVLVTLAPNTFAATAAPAPTGFGSIWGVAFWKGQVFGFTDNGEFITIDPATGVGTLVSSSSTMWWGAAVTTIAPVLQ